MIFTLIARCRCRKPHRVRLALPTYFSKGYIMKSLPLPNNAQAVVSPEFTDRFGFPASIPSTPGTATSSDATLFSASVTAEGKVLVIAVPGAVGAGTLTYTNGSLTDSGDVVVAAPVADSVTLDSADAVITAQTPAPSATPEPASASAAPALAPVPGAAS